MRSLARELDAALLVAIQDVFRQTEEFGHLAAFMAAIEIPVLDDDQARTTLVAIAEDRLDANGVGEPNLDAVLDDDALGLLIAFYRESGRNLRFTLAMLQMACEAAAEDGAELISPAHIRAATESWRDRTSA